MGDWLFGLMTGIILTLLQSWAWRQRFGPSRRRRSGKKPRLVGIEIVKKAKDEKSGGKGPKN